jgi:1-acyl-sn-glycerol-3-phosphate acyltransferase
VAPTERRPADGPPWAWRLAVAAVRWFLLRLFGWRVRARRPDVAPPPDQPLVVVFNHTSNLDAFLIADTVWRGLRHWVQPLVKAELFDVPGLGFLVRRTGAIPVTRAEVTGREAAFGAAGERLRSGGTLLLAPEGTVTHDGSLLPLRHGAARLALDAGVDVLVVTHFGAQRGFSPVVRTAERGVVVTMAFDLLTRWPDEDATALTGRIAATMLDRSQELRAGYPQADPEAPWWPPYSTPASPSSTARASLERYQESMTEAIAGARERMARFAEEHEVPERVAHAREVAVAKAEEVATRSRDAAEKAEVLAARSRETAEHLAEQARHRVEELTQDARELAAEARERAAHLAHRTDGAPEDGDAVGTDDATGS